MFLRRYKSVPSKNHLLQGWRWFWTVSRSIAYWDECHTSGPCRCEWHLSTKDYLHHGSEGKTNIYECFRTAFICLTSPDKIVLNLILLFYSDTKLEYSLILQMALTMHPPERLLIKRLYIHQKSTFTYFHLKEYW